MSTEEEFNLQQEITSLRSEVKALMKLCRRIKAKQDDPDGSKAKERAKNNGFNRKQQVTDKLRAFIGIPEGELVSRSEVTKKINEYITTKGLKHPENGRQMILDEKLKELLSPPEDTVVTFLNLQKFLSPHYIKPVETTTA